MLEPTSQNLIQATEYWSNNEPLKAGALLFENLRKENRPGWAANILQSVVKRIGVTAPALEYILQIARNPSEWKKGHSAFSAAREVTLELERLKVRTPKQSLLLNQMLLAELVAKVIYNATNPLDDFDEDSGHWIAVCVKEIIDRVDDKIFAESMWSVLCSETGFGSA